MASAAHALRRLITGKEIVVAPGVFSPAVALLAEKAGFRAAYFSGAAFSGLLGLPDLGMVTLTEVSRAAHDIASTVRIPLIVDVDTGFGEAVNVARTAKELSSAGAAAIQIEDQVMPKRCGHLEGKQIADADEMLKRVVTAKEAAEGRVMVIARTDARSVEGLDSAVERSREYARAGADIVFPEALESAEEFAEFRGKVKVPLMANMTEFGKTPYMTAREFEKLGYNLVVFPVTAFRAMMKSVDWTLRRLKEDGSQQGILDSLMTREEFYDLIGYDRFEKADSNALAAARRLRRRGRAH